MMRQLLVSLVALSAVLAGATPALAGAVDASAQPTGDGAVAAGGVSPAERVAATQTSAAATQASAAATQASAAATQTSAAATQASAAATQVSIEEIQRPANNKTASPYAGQTVTTTGTVTAVRADGDGYYIQNGTGKYSGVFVYTDGSVSVSVGDTVEITAPVTEFEGLTEIDLSGSSGSVTVTGSAAVPQPTTLTTGEIGQEAYEGVLVEVTNANATSTPGQFGEWAVDDGSGTVAIDDAHTGDDYTPDGTNVTFDKIVGPVYYSFGAFKIQPQTVRIAGQTSIEEIQRPVNDSTDVSPYDGQTVTTTGTVTAVRADGSGYFIQEGTGKYSGVFVYTGGNVSVSVGDAVEITAPVTEFNGLTEIDLSGGGSVTVTGSATVPQPTTLTTGAAEQEAYEGVLVEVTNVTATSTPGQFGEWDVDDGSGPLTIDGEHTGDDTTPSRANQSFERIVGPMSYTFGAYKMQPKTIESGGNGTTVTILAYTDIGSAVSGDGTMGRFITLINNRRSAISAPLAVVGNGDELSPHAFRGKVEPGWQPAVRALNTIDPAAEAVQNHELDYDESAKTGNFSIFAAASNASSFPWVNANVRSDTQELPGTTNHTIVTRGNQTIGIFSVADNAINTKAGNVLTRNGYRIEDYTQAAQREAQYLTNQANVDVVVALAPIGNDRAKQLARDTQNVDVVVTGDRDSSFAPTVVGDAVVTHPPGGASGIAEIKLTVSNGSVTPLGGQIRNVTGSLDRNSSWATYVDNLRARFGLDQVIATTEIPLSTKVDSYEVETAMGNAITRGVRNYTGADVAITNSGGIRGSAEYGPNITASHIRSTLAFGNSVVTMNVTGAELYAILESQMFVHQNNGGPSIGLQASGVSFEWIPHNQTDIPDAILDEGFGQLEDVYVNGEPLDRNATYTLATNSYIATGASDYPMGKSMWIKQYNTTMAEAVITWLNQTDHLTREQISPAIQGNMQVVDRRVSGTATANGDTVTVTATLPTQVVTVTDNFYVRNATDGRVNATSVTVNGSTISLTFDRDAWNTTVDTQTARVYGKYFDSVYTTQIRNRSGITERNYSVLNIDADDQTQSPLEGAPGRFDSDMNGDIGIGELGTAAAAFAQGDISINQLAAVSQVFAAN